MVTWLQSVYSTMVQEIAYDADREEMIVTWKGGTSGAYSGVPEDVAQSCAHAASVGQFINSEIKPIYAYRRLS